MTRALRTHAIVDHRRSITLQTPELPSGAQVEVIVLVESDLEGKNKEDQNALDMMMSIDNNPPVKYSNSTVQSVASRVELYRQAIQFVGQFNDIQGVTDLAAEHDRYLNEIYQ